MKEIWADIEGYDGKYQVSSWGRVRGARGIMKPYENHKGYLKIGLIKDGVKTKHRVNRLVAQAFIPNFRNYPEVNHKDGNKKNNSVTNLEWVTGKQNREHDKAAETKMQLNIDLAKLMTWMHGIIETERSE